MSGSVCRCNRYIVSSFRVHLATCWHRSAAPGRRDLLEPRQLRHHCRVHPGRKREGSDRPALYKALAAARVRQVPLVVAKVAPWRAVVAKLVVPTESLRAIATAILAAWGRRLPRPRRLARPFTDLTARDYAPVPRQFVLATTAHKRHTLRHHRSDLQSVGRWVRPWSGLGRRSTRIHPARVLLFLPLDGPAKTEQSSP